MVVDPTDTDDVRPVTETEHVGAGPAAGGAFGDAETEDNLRPVGHRVHPLDEPPLGDRVVAERVGVGVRAPERGQVQRGSSWAAGCSTAGIGTRPMPRTVG